MKSPFLVQSYLRKCSQCGRNWSRPAPDSGPANDSRSFIFFFNFFLFQHFWLHIFLLAMIFNFSHSLLNLTFSCPALPPPRLNISSVQTSFFSVLFVHPLPNLPTSCLVNGIETSHNLLSMTSCSFLNSSHGSEFVDWSPFCLVSNRPHAYHLISLKNLSTSTWRISLCFLLHNYNAHSGQKAPFLVVVCSFCRLQSASW